MCKEILKVFRNVWYIFLAGKIALIVFIFAVLVPNTKLLAQIIPNPSITIGAKVKLILSLFGSIQTNFTLLSASYTIAIAVLFGINIALFVYYIRKQRIGINKVNSVTGVGGLVSGIFGIGCATCGTFILTWAFGLIGVAGFISFLPLGGGEFGILGVILLIISIRMLSKKIQESRTCSSI